MTNLLCSLVKFSTPSLNFKATAKPTYSLSYKNTSSAMVLQFTEMEVLPFQFDILS
ncbi:hypothetical protein RchiOBHm_Chr2g0090211 [Rosa chinensis]|uniref:Uncharacterized protein n=1 Tax=Rosa chinensis TaxID=74649 RepID=A0A2P6RJD3_ROSCH|nr:hypothetical protein RchiOBHm_Chr2g0090211 [Rosa chinensis]